MTMTRVYKETSDDWCPAYKMGKVNLISVSMTQTGPDPKKFQGQYRVCVWGADDLGMERDFENREAEAHNVFMQVIGLPKVNIADLQQLGFVPA